MAKINSSAFRAGRVLAPDAKWTGEEPDWKGWVEWPVEKFMRTRMRMLGFYSYYLCEMDLRPDLLLWMKNCFIRKFTKEEIAMIKGVSPADGMMLYSTSKLARAINHGMPALHPEATTYFLEKFPRPIDADETFVQMLPKDDSDTVLDDVERALDTLMKRSPALDVATAVQPKKPKHNPHLLTIAKIDRTIIAPLEFMIDDQWGAKTIVEPLPGFLSLVRDSNTPASGCQQVAAWLETTKARYHEALDDRSGDEAEGYAYLGVRALNSRVKALDKMLDDVAKCANIKKAQRKPRIKKAKNADKQVARMKFQNDSQDLGVTSVNPTRIPCAYQLCVFNTKYRTLSFYQASGPAGFEVKGSGLKGFAPELSFTTTLRKPGLTITGLLAATPNKLVKQLEGLTTKRRPANGRFNEQTLILRVIDKKTL